jgi:hypothetical protein
MSKKTSRLLIEALFSRVNILIFHHPDCSELFSSSREKRVWFEHSDRSPLSFCICEDAPFRAEPPGHHHHHHQMFNAKRPINRKSVSAQSDHTFPSLEYARVYSIFAPPTQRLHLTQPLLQILELLFVAHLLSSLPFHCK